MSQSDQQFSFHTKYFKDIFRTLRALLLVSLVFKPTGKLNLGFFSPEMVRLKNVVFTIDIHRSICYEDFSLHGLPP